MSLNNLNISPLRLAFAICLLINSGIIFAEEVNVRPGADSKFWITTGFRSYHPNRNANYNETNTGLGMEYHLKDDHIVALGHYENSIRNHSTYLNYAYTPLQIGNTKFGAAVGVVNGYPLLRDGKFAPILMPVANTNFKIFDVNFGINTVYIPSIVPKVDGALAFQLKVALN